MSIQHSITQNPDFAIITIQLEAGQKVHCEPGAMASMDDNIKLTTSLQGGFLGSIKRRFGGESLIISTFRAEGKSGELILAAGQPGDAVHYKIDKTCDLLLQRGSYVAHSDGVEISSSWQGMRGFFSGEGLILLKVSGTGDLFFNSFGAIIEIDVEDDLYIDTGFIVAFEATLSYNVTTLPGLRPGTNWKSLFLGGEGLVCRFSGKGKVWMQSRQMSTFLQWVHPYRPTATSS